MKKLFIIWATVFVAFGFMVFSSAHNLNAVATSYHPEKMDSQLMCGPGELYVGEIAWVYPDTERMMVNGSDGSKVFDLSKATFKPFKAPMKVLPEADQFVTVKYTVVDGDRIASSVTEISRKTASLYVGGF